MSHPHTSAPGASGNEDQVNLKKIVAVGVVSLLIFAASAVVAWIILAKDTATYVERGMAVEGKEIGKPEIGIVDTVQFEGDTRLDVWRAEKAQVLGSYGWVDRKKGIIHLPVAEAMKEVVRRANAPGGAQ